MTETVQTALIVAVAPTLIALAGVITSLRNGRKADRLEVRLDGRLSQLLELTRIASFAKGVKHELEKDSVLKAEAVVMKDIADKAATQRIELPPS